MDIFPHIIPPSLREPFFGNAARLNGLGVLFDVWIYESPPSLIRVTCMIQSNVVTPDLVYSRRRRALIP
jgi:hypothetical protein